MSAKLIDQIIGVIYENGGRWEMAKIIAEENPYYFTVPDRKYLARRAAACNRVHRRWETEELRILVHNYGVIPREKLARQLGRTRNAITYKYGELINKLNIEDFY